MTWTCIRAQALSWASTPTMALSNLSLKTCFHYEGSCYYKPVASDTRGTCLNPAIGNCNRKYIFTAMTHLRKRGRKWYIFVTLSTIEFSDICCLNLGRPLGPITLKLVSRYIFLFRLSQEKWMKEMTAIKKQQGRKRFHFFKRFIKNLLQAMINFGFASEFDRKNLTIF